MADQTPPAGGWELPHEPDEPDELDTLRELLQTALEAVPAEIRARMVETLREWLRALRALLEWLIARLEPPSGSEHAAQVRDIPIL